MGNQRLAWLTSLWPGHRERCGNRDDRKLLPPPSHRYCRLTDHSFTQERRNQREREEQSAWKNPTSVVVIVVVVEKGRPWSPSFALTRQFFCVHKVITMREQLAAIAKHPHLVEFFFLFSVASLNHRDSLKVARESGTKPERKFYWYSNATVGLRWSASRRQPIFLFKE